MKQTDITPQTTDRHESDGRFALQLKTNAAVQRQLRRDAEREQRRLEIIAEFGEDDLMWA